MIQQTVVIVIGLGLAAWGHLLLHDLLGAANAWIRADERFPAAMRTPPGFAGSALLGMGALLVSIAVIG